MTFGRPLTAVILTSDAGLTACRPANITLTCFAGLQPLVINDKACAQEVGSHLASKVGALPGGVILVKGQDVVVRLALLALAG